MNSRLSKSLATRPLWHMDACAAAIICAAAGVWYFAGFAPLVSARAARKELEVELAGERVKLDQQAELVKKHASSLEIARQKQSASRVQLKAVDRVNQQVADLTRMAIDSGVEVDEVRPSPPVAQERFTAVPIRLTGTGRYEAVTNLLGRLRSDYHDTGITGFALRAPTEATGEKLKVELNLVWYAGLVPARADLKQK